MLDVDRAVIYNLGMSYDIKGLKEWIEQSGAAVIAIDGYCGSGKTFVADRLKELGCRVIRTDDFYPFDTASRLRAELNSVNLDFERLIKEIPDPSGAISYKKYDCKAKKFTVISLPDNRLTVIEGSYSHFPLLPYEMKRVYLECPYAVRYERIRTRSNFEDFIKKWLPMEEAYQRKYSIKEKADIILSHIEE